MSELKALTQSQEYVSLLGAGVNLGNTFDAFDRVNHSEIDDETAWGEPKVTQAYMNALKNHGFKSIRIPFTAFTRTGPAPDYTINETFFQRYQDVVDYALNAGLYVMVNLHHDSSEWLIDWDGNTSSEEYTRFQTLWTQMANRFLTYDNHVMFESINEPGFNVADDNADEQNNMLSLINRAFYDIVRGTGGNNTTRMLVLPNVWTSDLPEYSTFSSEFILGLNDENVIATVHWYASRDTYAYTANMGVAYFDEEYKNVSARESTAVVFENLNNAFISNGIGVIIGEYGLFNQGIPGGLNDGEVYKYIEYVNARYIELGICPMIWDVGLILDRHTGEWVNQTWGDIITASMQGRSSYATGLDHVFVSDSTISNDIPIPLTLNGNTLTAVYNGGILLQEGTDYTYADETLTLSGSYISQLIHGDYGTKAELHFVFSAGSIWRQYVNYIGTPSMDALTTQVREDDGYLSSYDTDGTASYPAFIIPVHYSGRLIRRIGSLNEQGVPTSSSSWASDYMQFGWEFKPFVNAAAYGQDILALMSGYNNAIPDGSYTLVVEFFDGDVIRYGFTRTGDNFTGSEITQ